MFFSDNKLIFKRCVDEEAKNEWMSLRVTALIHPVVPLYVYACVQYVCMYV